MLVYDRGTIQLKGPGSTSVTSYNQSIDGLTIRIFLINYANLSVTNQFHALRVHLSTFLSKWSTERK